jgi:glycosyltransferase involved in cell wall biosynthesis
MELEVLVATVGQKDLSLAKKMNIDCRAVIANQNGQWDFTQEGNVRMLSSQTVGVGINRNLALSLAEGDILLFADDDMQYYDGALAGVAEAFRQLPEADVIFFGLDMTRDGQVFDKRRNKTGRVHLWNSLRYGAARMAIRREAVEKHRLAFSTLFGGGCLYSSGEDTLFVRDCFRAGLKVYAHSLVLGTCAKDASSWFTGFNEKYMFDKGAWIACAFPHAKCLMKWYFTRKLIKKTSLSKKEVCRLIKQGIRAYPKREAYPAQTKQKV